VDAVAKGQVLRRGIYLEQMSGRREMLRRWSVALVMEMEALLRGWWWTCAP
jgi:hypothetical protein